MDQVFIEALGSQIDNEPYKNECHDYYPPHIEWHHHVLVEINLGEKQREVYKYKTKHKTISYSF
jgi:hypothetical protein